jgi:hypothetical protein
MSFNEADEIAHLYHSVRVIVSNLHQNPLFERRFCITWISNQCRSSLSGAIGADVSTGYEITSPSTTKRGASDDQTAVEVRHCR